MSYSQQGAIFDPCRQGMVLKAQCHGSSAPSYDVEATLNDEGIAQADCSCPVGGWGTCKHVAALLLTWIYNPDAFREIEDLETSLERRNKPELIHLIRQMLQRYPGLSYLLDLPSPSEPSDHSLDPEVIRNQVFHAFASSGDRWEWRNLFETRRTLDELLNLAQQYHDHHREDHASIIFRTMLEEILEYEDILLSDESSGLGGLVNDCVQGLGNCLDVIQDKNARCDILLTLFNVYLWDIKKGGIGLGDFVPDILLDQTTPEENMLIVTWIQSTLTGIRDWGKQSLGGLLIKLQSETLNDEEFLSICRQTGRTSDLVDRLLRMERVNEAVLEASNVSDFSLIELADIFVLHEQDALADQMVRERAESSDDIRLVEWLKENAIRRGEMSDALALVTRSFLMRQSLTGYTEMKKIAFPLNEWGRLRTDTIRELTNDKAFSLLVQIHLEEQEIDLALDALEKGRGSVRNYWEMPTSLDIQVAKAAQDSRPQQSIRLYMQEVNRLIGHRGRGNYAEATQYLIIVREIHHRLGKQDEWLSLINALRQENRNLPAFRDELNKAKL